MTVKTKPVTRAVKQADAEWTAVQLLADESMVGMKDLLWLVSSKYKTVEVLSWRKKHGSAMEKLARKGYSSYAQIGDLVKGVILTEDLQQAMVVTNFLLNHANVVKWEAKVGKPEVPYCGALHVDVQLGSLTCEIQVMPRATWSVKRETNHLYKTGRACEGSHLWSTVENFTQEQRVLLGV